MAFEGQDSCTGVYSVKDSSELSFAEKWGLSLCLGPLMYLIGHHLQVHLLP